MGAEPLAIAVALGLLCRAAVQIYAIPSSSMAPTLRPGDKIVVTPYLRSSPARGDVVVFASPSGQDELIIKRIVGMPGDLVDSRLGRVRIGGHTFPEPYVLNPVATGSIEAQVIPAGCYFVLGDNRGDSMDSRAWGVIPQSALVGRARLVLWSSDGIAGATARASAATDSSVRAGSSGRLFKWID